MGALTGKVAVVTGSSRGIGAAIAKRFAREGASVAVHGRDTTALSAVVGEIGRNGGKAIPVTADVTKFAEIESMRGQIEKEFGPIDILVANAGGSFTPPGSLEEIPEEGWHASIDGNLTGHISHDQEHSAWHEGAESGECHHDLISSGAAAVSPISHSVRRSEGGNPDPYAGTGGSSRSVRSPCKLHRAGNDSYRAKRRAHTRCAEEDPARYASDKASGQTR